MGQRWCTRRVLVHLLGWKLQEAPESRGWFQLGLLLSVCVCCSLLPPVGVAREEDGGWDGMERGLGKQVWVRRAAMGR